MKIGASILLVLVASGCGRLGFEARTLGADAASDPDTAPIGDVALGRDSAADTTETSDIESLSGQVDLARSPPASVLDGDVESDETTLLFLEREAQTLTADITADFRTPGTYVGLVSSESVIIPAGTVVTSYLLHVDRVGRTASVRYDGTIVFNKLIVGVMVRNETLNASDGQLGAPGTAYPTTSRSFDGEDSFSISEDRRGFTFSSATDSVQDQARIVLAAE